MTPFRLYRIQDAEGRGPFKPGFSRVWSDEEFANGLQPLPTLMEEFGYDIFHKNQRPGEFYGTAVRSPADLKRWFSVDEMRRLSRLGYNIVSMRADRIIAESKNQILFARKKPLSASARIVDWFFP